MPRPKHVLAILVLLLAPILSSIAAPIPGAPVVTNLYAGGFQSFLLFSDGSLWAAGLNSEGQLGDGTYQSPTYRFQEIRSNNVTFVSTGSTHTLVIHADGSLDATGDDTDGDLGDGGSGRYNTFHTVPANPTTVVSAAVGGTHSMFVNKNGALFGMGANSYSQLGDGTQNNTNKPEQIVRAGVASVVCCSISTFFLETNGSVWGTGTLGVHRYDSVNRPTVVLPRGAAAITAGGKHILILTTNGALLAFGDNTFGELGDATTNTTAFPEQIISNNVVAIAGGNNTTHFIKSDGSLWAMGLNDHGQLGDGTTNNSLVPELIIPGNVIAVASGAGHTLILKSDHTVWACGYDGLTSFGDNFTNDAVLTPQQIYPTPPPVLTITAPTPATLQFTAPCSRGGAYYLLATTDLSQPFGQWTSIATNTLLDRLNNLFTLTNSSDPAAPQKFYILQSP